MYKDIIDFISQSALKHIGVKSVKYQKRVMINQQNDNGYMQIVIEDDPYFQWIKTSNVFTLTLNMDVIGLPSNDNGILNVQNDALTIAVELINYITTDKYYQQFLSLYDYSLLGLSHFTDDNSAGFRLSLELIVPNPINLCNYLDNFDEDRIGIETDKPLDLIDSKPSTKSNELILKPIKLK